MSYGPLARVIDPGVRVIGAERRRLDAEQRVQVGGAGGVELRRGLGEAGEQLGAQLAAGVELPPFEVVGLLTDSVK
jgi:hypothetical protein